MAVVIFDPTQFKAAFPEFALVPDARLTILFNMAGASILDNTDASIVCDPAVRGPLLDLLVAHLLTLFGSGVPGAPGGGPSGAVGRVESATEGTVSTSLAYMVARSSSEAWFNQTQYGAMFWSMTAQFRTFRYVIAGQSGVGHALDFEASARRILGTGVCAHGAVVP